MEKSDADQLDFVFAFDKNGGFFALSHKQRRARYAYPTSPLTERAKNNPAAVAKEMKLDWELLSWNAEIEDSHYEHIAKSCAPAEFVLA